MSSSLQALTLVPPRLSDQPSDEQITTVLPEHHPLILAHLRLVSSVARRYENLGVPLDDLVQEGVIGLIRAVQKYCPEKGTFSTYALHWIKQAILRALPERLHMLHVPAWKIQALFHLLRVQRELQAELQEDPTPEQLAQRVGKTVKQVKALLDLHQEWHYMHSLNEPLGDEEERTLGDVLEASAEHSPEQQVFLKARNAHLAHLFARLTPVEQTVIALHFGLGNDGEEQSLQQIATRLHKPYARVLMIEQQALMKLRRYAVLTQLSESVA